MTIQEACNKDKSKYREYIVINGKQIEIEAELYQSAYSQTHFIGTFNLSYIKFKTQNNINYKKQEFDYFKEVEGIPIKIGHFYTTDINDNDTNGIINVTAYDNGLKFANPYQTTLDFASGKITLYQVLSDICTNVGVLLKNKTITNGNFIVDSNQFFDAKFGDVVSAVAFMSGDFATINANGELELVFKNETNEIIENYTELEDKRDTQPITSVSLGMEDVEGENVVLKDQALIDQYGEHWLVINDCPFAYTEEKRRELITAIFNKVKGFSYSSFVTKNVFKPYLKLGDLVKIRNSEGNLINSIVLKIESNYYDLTLSAPSITNAKVKYENPRTAFDVAKRAEIKVDKAKNEITANVTSIQQLSEKSDKNSKDISDTKIDLENNYYDKNYVDGVTDANTKEITQIKQEVATKVTAEDLKIEISKVKSEGATSVKTATGFTFDEKGLSIGKADSEMSSLLDNDGLSVKRNDTEVLSVRSDGVNTENLKVRTYFTIGKNTRVEDYKDGTGFFFIGGV